MPYFDIVSLRLGRAIAIVLLSLGPICGALAQSSDDTFLAARDAYNERDLRKLEALAPRLTDHPLSVYVAYWELSAHIKTASPAEIRSFISTYGDTPLAERLRTEWVKELGRQGNWQVFDIEYPNLANKDNEAVCYHIQSKLSHEEADIKETLRQVWFTSRNSPDACVALFDQLIISGALTAEDVWQRVRLALNANNVALAKQLNRYLPAHIRFNEKTIDTASSDPQRYLDKNKHAIGNRNIREVALFALLRLARNQPSLAAEFLKEIASRLSATDRGYAWGQIAYYGALNHDPDALAWYEKAASAPLNDIQIGWRVRSALRIKDWVEVLAGIEQLSNTEQREGNWRYWKARALKALNKPQEANEILVPLSKEMNFYGLLAGEELGATLSNPTSLWKPNELDVAVMREVPGIRRALYLNRLQMSVDALREWLMVTREFDDRRLLAAAEVASRAGWIDRAIFTADRTKELHDYSLRFPTPFRSSMTANARKYQLDEAWVYGLIRQESRFITEARSPVGAMGLMQLMPSTARWIATKLGIKNLRQTQVTEVNTNIALGTFYLKNILDSLGHPVLATAGYNAGPGRARRWRGPTSLEGAIYAETIPITETRDYVKKVMANATLYAVQLGLPPVPLKERLGSIPSQNTAVGNGNADLGPGG